MPERSFKQLAAQVLRNATQNEALNYEIVRALDTNLSQMDSLIQDLAHELTSFLEEHASRASRGFENAFHYADSDDKVYTLPLLKVLERGLLTEIDSIYELLRDLLLAWEFIEGNSPMISINPEDVVRKQALYETCEAWLR